MFSVRYNLESSSRVVSAFESVISDEGDCGDLLEVYYRCLLSPRHQHPGLLRKPIRQRVIEEMR